MKLFIMLALFLFVAFAQEREETFYHEETKTVDAYNA